MIDRDRAARIRSDERARELGNPNGLAHGHERYSQDEVLRSDAAARDGCSPILIALVVLALGALAWAVV